MVKQYTPEELTQLHQVLYEILEEIVRICDKHNIPYFVIGGTAIGALYDKAILPWDDDIDIGMKREDYNKFLQIASQELREPYFLSWIHTDPHSPYYFAKVKKNNTLFVEDLKSATYRVSWEFTCKTTKILLLYIFLGHNRNVVNTKFPYPIKRLEVIRRFNQKSMAFNQSLS